MKRRSLTLALLLLVCAGAASGRAPKPAPTAVAFVGVTVVPMDRERSLANQTVVVRDGRVAEIGPAGKVKVPAGALAVDGKGKYLMPGLAEMHGHLPHPKEGEELSNRFLRLFVANGVTTVRGMFGFPNHPALRDRLARGEAVGPTLYVASPAMFGGQVKTPEQARALVAEHKKAGFDLIKVHEQLSPEVYDALVAAAREAKIPVAGHVPDAVGLERALAARQSSIEHLDGYLEAIESDADIARLAAATRDAGVWNTPTMGLYRTIFGSESTESLAARPEMRFVPKSMVDGWAAQRAAQAGGIAQMGEEAKKIPALRDRMLKALADAGAKLLLGSDAPQVFSVPGFSLHREMRAMADAGLTPYQVLEAGTRNAAVYLGAEREFGTVEVGKRADLVLLDADPLADVANVARRSGVMLRGRWYPEAELRAMIE
jgi:imidazolonepropionase-like amidohydrolase